MQTHTLTHTHNAVNLRIFATFPPSGLITDVWWSLRGWGEGTPYLWQLKIKWAELTQKWHGIGHGKGSVHNGLSDELRTNPTCSPPWAMRSWCQPAGESKHWWKWYQNRFTTIMAKMKIGWSEEKREKKTCIVIKSGANQRLLLCMY